MGMPISSAEFRQPYTAPTEPVSDTKVRDELLYRAIRNPVTNRLPTILPLIVIAMAAFGIPQKIFMWGLLIAYLIATFAAAYAEGFVKRAIEEKRCHKRVRRRWLGIEFAASSIWGLILLPIADGSLAGSEKSIIMAVLMVTIAAGCLVSASTMGMSKAIIGGFIATALPASIIYYDNYGIMLVASFFVMFLGLIHLVSVLQKEAIRNLKTELEKEQLTTQLAEALDVAQYLSRRDSLTGLSNRRDFEKTAIELQAENPDAAAAIILLDLDHFKSVNDRHGHMTGDKVLKAAAQIISASLISTNTSGQHAAARWGGEEFVVALAGQKAEDAANIAEHIRAAFEIYRGDDWPGELAITASFGLATWPQDMQLNDAIRRADDAMFEAKSAGRNRVATFDDEERAAIPFPARMQG